MKFKINDKVRIIDGVNKDNTGIDIDVLMKMLNHNENIILKIESNIEEDEEIYNIRNTYTNDEYWFMPSQLELINEEELINNPIIYFARESKDVILPSKDVENAGYDVYAYFKEDNLTINPHETKLIPTGLHSCISEDYVLLGRERGSTGSIGMKCGAGVIDSGYRGEIFIAITNENNIPIIIDKSITKTDKQKDKILYPYKKGIAQLLLVPVPKATVKEISVKELMNIPSKRGNGKLGSSNK